LDYAFDTTALDAAETERLNQAYQAVKEKFLIQPTGYIDFRLEDFELCRQYLGVSVRNSFVLKHPGNDAYMLFVDTDPKPGIKTSEVIHNRHQVWGLAYLKKDFGRVMIRPETIADKLMELVHPIELDFKEDKAFSDTFYVLVDDHYKAVNAIDRNFRNAVMDVRETDMIIEIVNHTLLIVNRHPADAAKALHIAEFVSRLCTLCW